MPAKYPRLTITMRPALHALLRRLSELTGQSQSALIFELLDGAEPVLTRVIRLLEKAELAKEELHGHLARDMAGAQQRIERQLALSLDDLGLASADQYLVPEVDEDGPQRRARRVASGSRREPRAKPTPLSNRGVRSLTSTVEKTSRGRKA